MNRRIPLAVTAVALLVMGIATTAPFANAAPAPVTTVLSNGAPDIAVADVRAQLTNLQNIATGNGGNRYTGKPGYRASVDHVKAEMAALGYTVSEQSFSTSAGVSYNVLAELPGIDTSKVIMAGSHLDSVSGGPGINDNGSGSASLLAVAKAFKNARPQPAVTVRFGWWGAEELGLLGSKAYVAALPAAERTRIKAYLNFDMTGSPNPGYFVYNDDANGVPLRTLLTNGFTALGVQVEGVNVNGRSDHAAFYKVGIPTGGTFSGAEGRKSAAQAAKWGGAANQAFDPCYHRACDGISNINDVSLERHADVISYALWELTGSTAPPSPTPVPTPTATASPPPPSCVAVTNDDDVAIVDRSTVTSSVTVSGCTGNASATAKVAVDIKHTWRGDLVLSLLAPDGSSYLLEDFPNSDSTDNVAKTYTVNLAAKAANGTWKLSVQDLANQDNGKIDSWTLAAGG